MVECANGKNLSSNFPEIQYINNEEFKNNIELAKIKFLHNTTNLILPRALTSMIISFLYRIAYSPRICEIIGIEDLMSRFPKIQDLYSLISEEIRFDVITELFPNFTSRRNMRELVRIVPLADIYGLEEDEDNANENNSYFKKCCVIT